MNIIFKFLFERLTDPLGLPINVLAEYIILGVIGTIAYIVAFRIVGDMYHGGQISTRTGGSIFHWLIRLLFFVPIWAVTYFVIWVGELIIAHWAIALAVLSIALFTSAMVVLYLHNRRKGGVANA